MEEKEGKGQRIKEEPGKMKNKKDTKRRKATEEKRNKEETGWDRNGHRRRKKHKFCFSRALLPFLVNLTSQSSFKALLYFTS